MPKLGGGIVRHDDIEPLETGVWLRQLRELATSAPQSAEALARSLRRGFFLVQLTPRPLRHVVSCSLSEREFEELLESDALLMAALELLGDRLNYSLTRLDGGRWAEAEVWFPHESPSSTASGPTAPFAIFQAWLQCLATLDERADFSQLPAGPPIRRKSQFSLRPRSTEH